MATTLNRPSNIRILAVCMAMCIGGYIGQLSIWSEIFSSPTALIDPWHVTSALRKQGSDRLEPATHLHQGGLRLLAYQSVTADQAQLDMDINTFSLSVTPNSNLRISVGNQNPYNINIQDGFLQRTDNPNIDMTKRHQFVFQDGFVQLQHQNTLLPLGRSNGTEVRFSSFKNMAEINHLSCRSEDKVLLELQKQTFVEPLFMYLGIVLGGLLGFSLHISHLIGLVVVLWTLHTPISFWFQLQEKLSLTGIKPWVFQQNIIILSFLPISISLLSQFSLHIKSKRVSGNHFVYLWCVAVVAFLATHIQKPLDVFWVAYVLLPLSIPKRVPFRNQWWYAFDLISIVVLFLPKMGLLLSLLCRWVILLQNVTILRRWNARALLDIAFVYLLCIPIAFELLLPTPQIMIDNTPSEWKQASASFQASCGSKEQEYRILYVGGSSAGGAYQLQGSAFFSQYIHEDLCEQGFSVTTRNIGGAARNSYTIAESMNVWMQFEPHLIVFYGGVNDTLDKRYTQSRREREEALQMSRSIGLLSFGSQSDTIQILGRLLSQQNQEQVSEVSVEEAQFNLLQISSLPQSKTLLLTEWVRAPLKKDLQSYEDLQKDLASQNPNIYHLDLRQTLSDTQIDKLLIDANHPSAEGHQKMADIIQKWMVTQVLRSQKEE